MKKTITLILGMIIFLSSFSQDTVRLVHTNYTSVFSKSKAYPVLVQWWVTKNKVSCISPVKRSDRFVPDPLLPNETNLSNYYKGSGFDRGHMSPAADNLCNGLVVMSESFYFSNMSPQYHSLNAGDWKSLETFTRESAIQYDSIRVWCGNLGETKKIGILSVPEKCWKVIYIKQQKKYYYYIFDNNQSKPDGFKNNEISEVEFKKQVKLKLSL
jgi:endonuclease G